MPTNVEVAPTPEEQKERESHEHVSVSYGYEVGVSSDHLVSSHTNTAMHRFHDSVVQSIVKMEPGMDYNEHALIAIAQADAQIQPPPLPRCSRTRLILLCISSLLYLCKLGVTQRSFKAYIHHKFHECLQVLKQTKCLKRYYWGSLLGDASKHITQKVYWSCSLIVSLKMSNEILW